MAKKNHNKLYVIVFLFIVLSSGFPVLSFPFPNFANEDTNIFGWQFIDGEWTSESPIQFAEAIHTDGITPHDPIENVTLGRQQYYENTQVGERIFRTTIGLTPYILDNQGDYVERIVNSNGNGTSFESGKFTYYYDKNSCGMTIYEHGRMIPFEIPIIKYNGWVVKEALNGTNNWSDLPVNFGNCVVTVVDDDEHTMITSVKSDSNGNFTQVYDIPKPLNDMKATLSYFNNDATKDDTHKFAFTNILDNVPDHFSFLLKDEKEIEGDPVDYAEYFGYTTSPNTIPFFFNSSETIQITNQTDIPRDLFFHNNNTDYTTGFAMYYWSEEREKLVPLVYEFVNDSIDKLWNVKIIRNPSSFSNHVYIDYMNTNQTLPTGGETTLDPDISTLFANDIHKVTGTSQVFFGSGIRCTNVPALGFGTDFAWAFSSVGGMVGGRFSNCTVPMITFDITGIPTLASVQQIDFSYNVTSHFATSGNPTVLNEWRFGATEDVRFLTGTDAGNTIFADVITPDTTTVNAEGEITMTPSTFLAGGGGTATPFTSSFTAVDPSAITDNLELKLEAAKSYYIMSGCNERSGFEQISDLPCDFGVPTSTSFTTSWIGDASSLQLVVTWEVFGLPTAPLSVVCTFTAGDNFVDWETPTNNGGTAITGYQVERNSGAGFSVLVADTGSGIPTSFTDPSVQSGVTFTYRITAINDSGLGTPSANSNSCGVPELPTAPFGLTATNLALNVVALDWTAPIFDGNSPITGYGVNRTTGTIVAPDAIWQLKEHDSGSGANVLFSHQSPTNTGVRLAQPLATSESSTHHIFKSGLPADFLDGLTISVTWAGSTSVGGAATYEIVVLDGDYDRTDFTDFPSGSPQVLKGAGLLQTCDTVVATGFNLQVNGCTLDTSGSTLGTVTIDVRKINCSCQGEIILNTLAITGYNTWAFPVGTIVTTEQGGTLNDWGIATALTNTFTGNVEGFKPLTADTGSTITEFIDNTVVVNTEYGYRVLAINTVGNSPVSNTAVITTVGLPNPPDNVSATSTGTATITVQWTAPDVTGTTISGYQIDRKIGVGGIFATIEPFTNSQDTTFNDQLLASGTEYCYRLKTFTNIGLSDTFSDEDCATTQDQADPPQNLIAIAIDGSQINIQWDTPADDGGSTITGYKLERKKSAEAFFLLAAERTPESNRILNDTGREVGTLYTYRISAVTAFGDGETAEASATTDATPQAPQNFVCTPASTTAINLSWTTPLTFSPPTGYQIDRKEVGGSFSTIESDTGTTATTFQDTGLAIDSIFVYKVLGHTTEGDTDFSVEITCGSLSAPDFPPEDVQGNFNEVVPHQTVLTWDIPETFGIPITEFRIERDDGTGYDEIGSVSGSSITFTDIALDNDVDQRYQVITVGTQGETPASIAIPSDTNQLSHWHYENTIDDTGAEKNTGTILGSGMVDFSQAGHVGQGLTFNNTRIEVDVTQESDYDFDNSTSFGISSYYKGDPSQSPAFDDEWQIREQEINVAFTVNCNFNITPPFSIDMTLNTGVGFCHVFKVFDKADIIGQVLNVTWAGSGSSADMRTRVYDGSYDRDTPSDFPLTTGTNGFTAVLKGGGVLHAIDRTVVFSSVTDSITMTMAGSTESQVTIAVSLRDPSNTVNQFMDLTEIKIIGVDTWTWDSSATRTMEVSGTQNDKGFSNANFTSTFLVGQDQIIVSKSQTLTDTGYKFYIDKNGNPTVRLTNTETTNEISVQATTDVTDNSLHFIGFGYNGNGSANGISLNVDGTPFTPVILTDTLTGSILNNEALTIGGSSTGTNLVNGTLDETRIFGSGTVTSSQLIEVANDEIETIAPINATMVLAGSTFANISGEIPTITLISGFPLPAISTIDLKNFTATTVNSVTPAVTIDPITGQFIFDKFFNIMSSQSNYTAETTLTNIAGSFPLLSNFDIQQPVFTFLGNFFFQQARNQDFTLLSFNFTSSTVPFDLSCNLKSELFGNGTTFTFINRFFVQELFTVPRTVDIVVACIDPSIPPVDPLAPSFGGSNALLSFVSFGDSTGISSFLAFTDNYGDFFGAGLPFLFIIILAALFTGRSAPTGIIIIGVAIGIMWFLEIITIDPIMWGVIVVLVILGALAGKKFL